MSRQTGMTARARARACRHLRDARNELQAFADGRDAPRPHPTTVFHHAAAAAAWEAAAWLHGPDGVQDRDLATRFARESAEAWKLLVDRADASDPWALPQPRAVPRGDAEWIRRVVDDALADLPDGGEH